MEKTDRAADDAGRYAMNGVQVADPGDGTFRCAVTDGRRLLVARGVCPKRGELGDLGGPPDASVIVPPPDWNELIRAAHGFEDRGFSGKILLNRLTAYLKMATGSGSLRCLGEKVGKWSRLHSPGQAEADGMACLRMLVGQKTGAISGPSLPGIVQE